MIPMWKLNGRMGNHMFQYAYLLSQQRKGLIPDIYVQDEKYFEDVKDEIKAVYGQGVVKSDYVAIHVRRGDYVGHSFYVDLMTTDYYQRAMLEFPNEKFLVFSDDIEWCSKQEIFKDCEFSHEAANEIKCTLYRCPYCTDYRRKILHSPSEIDDFNKMAGCKGVIMSNSTFSWWAAYLNNGKVVAPEAWHPDGVKRTILLNKWVVL